MRLMKPTNAKKLKLHPVKYKAIKEPVIARGIAENTISGCLKDLN